LNDEELREHEKKLISQPVTGKPKSYIETAVVSKMRLAAIIKQILRTL